MKPTPVTVWKLPSGFSKRRLGSEHDGGYILPFDDHGLAPYDLILTAGLCGDINFEKDVLRMAQAEGKKIPIALFDGTIDDGIIARHQFEFRNCCSLFSSQGEVEPFQVIKKNIDPVSGPHTDNLHTYLDRNGEVLFKMDIEGAEFHWLYSLQRSKLYSIRQLVIEVHAHPPTGNRIEDSLAFMEELSMTHNLVHIHGCNCNTKLIRYQFPEGINDVPKVIELTYLRNDLFPDPLEVSDEPIPGPLDRPDCAGPDYHLHGYPYCQFRLS